VTRLGTDRVDKPAIALIPSASLPPRMMRLLLALLSLSLLSAGCIGDSGGSAKLSYDGDDIGAHSESEECDKDGHLLGSGSVGSGSVRVVVTTDDGERYGKEFTGDFTLASQELSGQSGTWTLQATRAGGSNLGLSGFQGSYSFTLTC
jgi:hypothetical protein